MILQTRDIELINYIENNGGLTVKQIAELYFDNRIYSAYHRLEKLRKAGVIKSNRHLMIGKLVFYTKKMPSYHNLVLNDVYIALKDYLTTFKKEFELGKYRVDAIGLINDKLFIFEVDIYNKTSEQKIKDIKNYCLKELKTDCEIVIINSFNSKKAIKGVQFKHFNVNNLTELKGYAKSIYYKTGINANVNRITLKTQGGQKCYNN